MHKIVGIRANTGRLRGKTEAGAGCRIGGRRETGYCRIAARSVSGRGHHKHSARLIQEHGLPGVDERELKLIASVARAHRKSEPRAKHMPYGSLGPEDQDLARRLAAILRVADGLDRSHSACVQHVEIYEHAPHAITLVVKAVWMAEVEKYGFNKKKALLEELLGAELRLEVHDVREGD